MLSIENVKTLKELFPVFGGEKFYIVCYDADTESQYVQELFCYAIEIFGEDSIVIEAHDCEGWWGEISLLSSEDYELYSSRADALAAINKEKE